MNRVLKKSMRIPRFGFTIEKQQKTVGRDVAFEVLTPARQRKSTLAVFENDNVVITKSDGTSSINRYVAGTTNIHV